MTDKEQIIIDGVDVSECTFHYQNKEGKHKCFKCDVVTICDGACSYGAIYLKEQLARKTQECEKLKEQLMQKDEVNTFFNTPIEGWSDDPCEICSCKNELQLAEQLIDGVLKALNLEAYDWRADQNEIITEIKAFKQECEELKEQLRRTKHIALNQTNNVNFYEKDNDRYRKALEMVEEYCDKQISLTGDLPFRTTESDILDIIKKAKGEEMNNNKLDNDFSMVFKHGLIAQIRQAGGTFNPKINDDGGKMSQKKFFAFKFDPKKDIENQILYQMQRMFEIVDQHRIDELSAEWQDIEFNVAKLENLRDGYTFVDLYRGLVLFRRKAND